MNSKLIAGMALASVALTGCAKEIVYKDRIVEVKVPVTVPCKTGEPDPVVALRESIGREQWDALTTDQRENLLAAQALAWRVFGWQKSDTTAGCR